MLASRYPWVCTLWRCSITSKIQPRYPLRFYTTKIAKLPPVDWQIPSSKVRLVDDKGKLIGEMELGLAIARAKEKEMQVLMLSEQNGLAICKMYTLGKYKYQQQQKTKKATQNTTGTAKNKEIRFSSKIAEHDVVNKVTAVQRFLFKKNSVKVTIAFDGVAGGVDEALAAAMIDNIFSRVELFTKRDPELLISNRSASCQFYPIIERVNEILANPDKTPEQLAEEHAARAAKKAAKESAKQASKLKPTDAASETTPETLSSPNTTDSRESDDAANDVNDEDDVDSADDTGEEGDPDEAVVVDGMNTMDKLNGVLKEPVTKADVSPNNLDHATPTINKAIRDSLSNNKPPYNSTRIINAPQSAAIDGQLIDILDQFAGKKSQSQPNQTHSTSRTQSDRIGDVSNPPLGQAYTHRNHSQAHSVNQPPSSSQSFSRQPSQSFNNAPFNRPSENSNQFFNRRSDNSSQSFNPPPNQAYNRSPNQVLSHPPNQSFNRSAEANQPPFNRQHNQSFNRTPTQSNQSSFNQSTKYSNSPNQHTSNPSKFTSPPPNASNSASFPKNTTKPQFYAQNPPPRVGTDQTDERLNSPRTNK